MSLSKGDSLGDFRRSSFLHRRSFPTRIDHGFDVKIFTGGFNLSKINDSYSLPSFSGSNHQLKPPWPLLYNHRVHPIMFSLSLFYQFEFKLLSIMSDFLRKSVQDLDLGVDDVPIVLSPEFVSQAASVNRFSLIVTTVNPRKQNLRALIGQMPRVWGLVDSCVGRIVGNGRVQFKFRNEESMNLVLQRGPWSFNDWMLSVHRWFPNITEGEMKIIPFWVQIQGIPILYLTNAMARVVGSRLGYVTDVDFDENANQMGFVRVKLAWNFDDHLRFQRNFQFQENENTIIKFRFERLRNFCTKCGSLKHDVKECNLSFEEYVPVNVNDDNDDDNHDQGHDEDDMAAEDSLPSIDPASLIPGLQGHNAGATSVKQEGSSSSVPSDLASAFEDTELTAERLRYLHAKHVRETLMDHQREAGLLEEVSDNATIGFPFVKRKRVSFEMLYNQAEAEEESAVLGHIRKRDKKVSLGASVSSPLSMDGGAGSPVPPQPP